MFPVDRYGSIESRMKITGGDLRFLFDIGALRDLRAILRMAADGLEYTMNAEHYFSRSKEGDRNYHRAISCSSESPFTEPGTLGYASDFIRDAITDALLNLRSPQRMGQAMQCDSWLQEFLGFAFLRGTVRGWFFEDLAISLMCSDIPACLELTPRLQSAKMEINFDPRMEPLHGPLPTLDFD
jgi:hypothetical protein